MKIWGTLSPEVSSLGLVFPMQWLLAKFQRYFNCCSQFKCIPMEKSIYCSSCVRNSFPCDCQVFYSTCGRNPFYCKCYIESIAIDLCLLLCMRVDYTTFMQFVDLQFVYEQAVMDQVESRKAEMEKSEMNIEAREPYLVHVQISSTNSVL